MLDLLRRAIDNFTCTCCQKSYTSKESFQYKGILTKSDNKVCGKCFIREFGKKEYKKGKEENSV